MRVAAEGPQLLDEPVVEFLRPLAAQEGLDLLATDRELGAVAPAGVFRVDPRADFGVARVPGVLGAAHLLRRSLFGERRNGRTRFHQFDQSVPDAALAALARIVKSLLA
jgi:hypothetical protein